MTAHEPHLPPNHSAVGIRNAIAAILGADRLWCALWIGALLAVTVLYFLPEAVPPGNGNIDKIMHLAAFGTIGLPLPFAARSARAFRRLTAFTLIYAPLLEFGHLLVPARSFSFFDMAANITGIAIGIVMATTVACALKVRIADPISPLRGTSRGSATPPK